MAEENPFARLFRKPSVTAQLAILEAGEQHAPVQLRLINADLDDTAYQCISYDRSRDGPTVDVSVDGQPLSVPQPLAEALRALRMQERPRTVWADLLVGDSAEQRSRQASTMKSVVENSDSVIVWLGPGDAHTPGAFEVLQELGNRYQQACLHSGFPTSSRATQQQTTDLYRHLASKPLDALQPSNKALWNAVTAYLSSSYFSSAHSIPEIVLAKNVIVTSGDSSLPWLAFMSASWSAPFYMAQQLDMAVPQAQQTVFVQIQALNIADRRRRNGESLELLPMIGQARDCSTTDLREIVFSVLPIISPSQRALPGKKEPPPVADYSKNVHEVFTDAARYIVHERQDLMLWWAEVSPRRRRVLGLPSWVPDWSTGLSKTIAKVMPTEKNGMRAWWDHIRPTAERITVDKDNTLHVQAHALDKVVSVSPILTPSNCRRLCLTEWQALPDRPGETPKAKLEKFWRSLIYNQAGMGETLRDSAIPPEEMWQSFYSIIAEERILEWLGCTPEQLMTQPELIARAKADPEMSQLGPYTGRSPPFEELLHANGLGRRIFQTESGRVGVTAVEELIEDPESQPSNGQPSRPPAPDFDHIMHDPMARSMIEHFQRHLQQQNPEGAAILQQSLSGGLKGQRPPGVRVGDIVVALVGGFQPYVLRPVRDAEPGAGESSQTTLESVSKYTFVGDCYMHGVMDGEPFKVSSAGARQQWKTDVKLVDISIV